MSDQKPMIGSYRNPNESEPNIVDKRKETPSATKNMVEGIHEDLEQSIKETTETTKRATSYEDHLKKNDISTEYAETVVDDLMTKGYYEEVIPLSKTRTVTFRTRKHSDYIRYCRALELFNPKYVDEQQEIAVRYFLAASLVACKGESFNHPDDSNREEVEKEFKKRLAWVENQPEVLTNLLAHKLRAFDNRIRVVMSEGVIENF